MVVPKFWKCMLKKSPCPKKTNLKAVAQSCPGFSGADLRNLLNEAALYAARKNLKSVGEAELSWARDRVLMGPERRGMVITEEQKTNTAYHEAGHALVGAVVTQSRPRAQNHHYPSRSSDGG